jgi:hypothetical protein
MVTKEAFVAMKFDGDPWNDRRYMTITEILEEAGFHVTRGDEVRSAAPVMSDVTRFLGSADLVVIDSTGDSHNVSYEIGFCHGMNRDPTTMVLLRKAGDPIPFNYSHYRHLQYRDIRHLRHLLRHRLEITVPLSDAQTAYCFAFVWDDEPGMYGSDAAEAVVQALEEIRFTGRCEYYAADRFGAGNLYVVGLGLQSLRPRRKLALEWWWAFVDKVSHALVTRTQKLRLAPELSGFHELLEIRGDQLSRGAAEFSHGRVVQILSGRSDDKSWFEAVAMGRLRAHST